MAKALVDDAIVALDKFDVEDATLDERGWGGWLLDRLDRERLSDEAVRLFEIVGKAAGPQEGLNTYLAQLEPMGKELAAGLGDGVRIMTMAQSKGLTVNTAIVMGVEQGMMPLPKSSDLDEERRLLYVAMTRATDMCLLTWASRRTGQTARMGAPAVTTQRNRSPLLANLPGNVGRSSDGQAFVAALVPGL